MKQPNIKRLERAAGMLEKCADLISDVVYKEIANKDCDIIMADNCYRLKQSAGYLRYMVSSITRFAKVAKEDAANEV